MDEIRINEKFKPLYETEDNLIIFTGGRGSGKSFTISDFACRLTYELNQKILFNRYTMTSAHLSIIPEYKEKLNLWDVSHHFTITKEEIVNNLNGSEIIFKGIKTSSGNQTGNLKSIKDPTTWIIDEADEIPDYNTYQKIKRSFRKKGIRIRVVMAFNPPFKSHWIYQTFFKPNNIPEYFNGSKDGITYIHTTYLDNIENLNEDYLNNDILKTKERNFQEYEHVFLGKWAEESNNAIWRYAWIEKNRATEHPTLKRIVVAIDPSVTSTEQSDECGIVVAGLGIDNQYYVLEDQSGIYTPNGWALKSIYLYEKYKADRIVAEVNNGGDLVETVIKNFDKSVAYKSVHASRGKVTRAEPIAAFYEQNQVHHVGILKDLEYQMTTWDETQGISPGRIDALVWALTELSTPKVNTNSWA